MGYFDQCKTKDEAKKLYKKLAKKMHPDQGGDAKQMAELTRQHEAFTENRFGSAPLNDTSYHNAFESSMNDTLHRMHERMNRANEERQRYYQGFEFNRIKRPMDIPFDHPIHEKVRIYENRISQLERDLRTSTNSSYIQSSEYSKKSLQSSRENQMLRDENESLKQLVKHMQEQLERPKEPASIWELIKQKVKGDA